MRLPVWMKRAAGRQNWKTRRVHGVWVRCSGVFFNELGEWPEAQRTRERIKGWFEQLFSTKDPDLLYGLGFLYELGYQGERDMDKALALYKKAAALGDTDAIRKLKELHSVF